MLLGGLPVRAEEPVGEILTLSVTEEATHYVGQEVNVKVTAPEEAEIYYTTDGSNPTDSSTPLTGDVIVVTAEEPGVVTVKALAIVNQSDPPVTAELEQAEQSKETVASEAGVPAEITVTNTELATSSLSYTAELKLVFEAMTNIMSAPDTNDVFGLSYTLNGQETVGYYKTLDELTAALDSVDTGATELTVQLVSDVTMDTAWSISRDLTLDLNGQTLIFSGVKLTVLGDVTLTDTTGGVISLQDSSSYIQVGSDDTPGSLMIMGGTVTTAETAESFPTQCVNVTNSESSLSITEGVSITNNGTSNQNAVAMDDGGLTMTGGTLVGGDNGFALKYGEDGSDGTTVAQGTISGGTFTAGGGGAAIYFGTWEISGGAFAGTGMMGYGAYFAKDTMTVSGGRFKGGMFGAIMASSQHTYADGCSLSEEVDADGYYYVINSGEPDVPEEPEEGDVFGLSYTLNGQETVG